MARLFDLPLELPNRYYAPIGEVLYRWALLEFQIQAIIWRTLSIDNKQGRTLTVGMDAKVLVGILRTLMRYWAANRTEIRMMESLAKHTQALTDDWNILAHGVWMYPLGGTSSNVYLTYMKKSHQRILPFVEKRRPHQITATANKLRKLNKRADRLIKRLEKKLPIPPPECS